MRIGPFTLFERTKPAGESYKGSVAAVGSTKPGRKTFHLGEHTWASRCRHFDTLALEYPLFSQSCLALAGIVMSQGVYFSPAVNKQDETYALAEDAVYRCEKWTRTQYVNSRLYDTTTRLAKYGSCFWEVTRTPDYAFRVCPSQEYIEPAEADAQGTVTAWRQRLHTVTQATWPDASVADDADPFLVHLAWNVTPQTWPYGTSLGSGLDTELSALIDMENSAKDYMEKQAWPYEVLQLGNEKSSVLDSDYQTAKTEWKNRKPGEGIATRNMPIAILPGGTGSAPIRELAVLCEFMKDNVHDGLAIPPMSKLYNSTEASATVLTGEVMTRLGQPIQWLLKEALETHVLKPYLEASGFSRKSCPTVLFESPDVHKAEEGQYWTSLVGAKIVTPQQAAEHLGIEYDEAYWKAEQQRHDEQFQLKQKESGGKPNGEEEKKENEPVEEWVVRRRSSMRGSGG